MTPGTRHSTSIARYFHKHRLARMACMHVVVLSFLAVAMLASPFGKSLSSVFADAPCPDGDKLYKVASGDSVSLIAQRNDISWQDLAKHNKLDNPDLIFVDQNICIPTKDSKADQSKDDNANTDQNQNSNDAKDNQGGQSDKIPVKTTPVAVDKPAKPTSPTGAYNSYPYGQCTWWADNRYKQLHGVYVPWLYGSDAWKWPTRAKEYGWKVSNKPIKGSILVLQPWVQGAYSMGHVAIVEKILPNGHVLTSNMNWGGRGGVVNVEFTPGRGVSFVTR